MLKEFRAFVMRGNVLDLAVAVMIGAAFGKIVSSLTDDIIMPVIGRVLGGLDFSSYFLVLGQVPPALAGSTDYLALKKAGVPLIGYGAFLTQVVSFLVVAAIIFLLLRAVSKATALLERDAVPVTPAPEPIEIALLREIRDELRSRSHPSPPL
jgi:large conductance mechanosensitive channel